MTDHLTPQMLALYLGCECLINSATIDNKIDTLQQISHLGDCSGKEYEWEVKFCQPILRPTHTINYDDALKYVTAMYPQWQVEVIEVEKENKNRTRGFWYRYNSGRRWSKKYWMFHWALPISTQTVTHLLKERFDLYDWIEKGLAIDATKIKKP